MPALPQLIKQAQETKVSAIQEAAQKEKRHEEETIKGVQQWLWKSLGAEVYDELSPWDCANFSRSQVKMTFQYNDEAWTLDLHSTYFSPDDPKVSVVNITSPKLPESPHRTVNLFQSVVGEQIRNMDDLRHVLLLMLGGYDTTKADRVEQMNAFQEQQEREQAQEQQRLAQRKAKRAELELSILANQTAWIDDINAKIAEAEAARWVWPEGTTLTLYYWEWHYGGVNETGDVWGETEAGWSTMEWGDEGNWVRILNPERDVKIVPDLHTPVVTRYTYRSVDDMQRCRRGRYLLEHKPLHIPGYYKATSAWIDDINVSFEHPVLMKDADQTFFHDGGYEPIVWMKALVEELNQ